jgi:hypothetical protein
VRNFIFLKLIIFAPTDRSLNHVTSSKLGKPLRVSIRPNPPGVLILAFNPSRPAKGRKRMMAVDSEEERTVFSDDDEEVESPQISRQKKGKAASRSS